MIQTVHDGRQFMKYIDPKLGVPLPERDYGGNCLIYDPGNTTDPFHNIWVRLFNYFYYLICSFRQFSKDVLLWLNIALQWKCIWKQPSFFLLSSLIYKLVTSTLALLPFHIQTHALIIGSKSLCLLWIGRLWGQHVLLSPWPRAQLCSWPHSLKFRASVTITTNECEKSL